MDSFIVLLDSKYRILTWNAMIILANLTNIDTEKKFDAIFDKYYSFINNDYMVTVANLVGNSGKIAQAKPYLAEKITEELLKVEHIATTPHLTEECKRVIAEKAISAFDMFFDHIQNKDAILFFVRRQLDSPRESLKTKAEQFIEKWKEFT
jgi:hypothetical protein